MSTEPEWMQWLGQEPEPETELPPAAVVPLRGADSPAATPDTAAPAEHPAPRDQGPKREAAATPVWPHQLVTAPPLVLVTGVGGGAGATTTAVGIAGAWATHDANSSVAVVDLTVTGGDLASRAAAEDRVTTIDTLIEPESRLGDADLAELLSQLGRDHGVAAVGDVGERPAVDEGRRALERLDEVRVDGVAEERRHRAGDLEVLRQHRPAVEREPQEDPAQAALEIHQVLGEA